MIFLKTINRIVESSETSNWNVPSREYIWSTTSKPSSFRLVMFHSSKVLASSYAASLSGCTETLLDRGEPSLQSLGFPSSLHPFSKLLWPSWVQTLVILSSQFLSSVTWLLTLSDVSSFSDSSLPVSLCHWFLGPPTPTCWSFLSSMSGSHFFTSGYHTGESKSNFPKCKVMACI